MRYTIDALIPMIENIQADLKSDPRKGLLQLRQLCMGVIQILESEDPFAHEQQKIQSTVWMIEQITATDTGFDRWLLFGLRSKKLAISSILRNYSLKADHLIAA